MLKSMIIITVSVFWTLSLADLRLSCHPLTPTCPGTVVNCQCNGAAGSVTWRISSERSSCRIEYYDPMNTQRPDNTDGNCGAVTTDVSTESVASNPLFLFNSNLSINLMESVTVSCGDTTSNQIQHPLRLTSTCLTYT